MFCDASYKLSSKSNASVSLKLQLHPWQSSGIWTFEDGLFKFALLWAKIVFKCLNKCQIWSSIFFKKTALASMKLVLGHLCVKVNCWPWNISIKKTKHVYWDGKTWQFLFKCPLIACGLPRGKGGRKILKLWNDLHFINWKYCFAVIYNLRQPSPFLAILIHTWFTIFSFVCLLLN